MRDANGAASQECVLTGRHAAPRIANSLAATCGSITARWIGRDFAGLCRAAGDADARPPRLAPDSGTAPVFPGRESHGQKNLGRRGPEGVRHRRATMKKRSLPLARVYRLLEPGPLVLLATAHRDRVKVMTMSWHAMMEFEPPLIGVVVSDRNFSFGLLRAGRQCTINVPTVRLATQVVGCGHASGRRSDKFARFELTPVLAKQVAAPLVGECFTGLECRVADTRWVPRYCLFVLEVVQAWIDPAVTAPRSIHHRGRGEFMVAGRTLRLPSRLKSSRRAVTQRDCDFRPAAPRGGGS
jgi:flavin reductase (DIM6/NTAB) family NADH-FMN oxidoreductase RutF